MSSPTAPGYVACLVVFYNHLVCGWFCIKYNCQQINTQYCSLHYLGDHLYLNSRKSTGLNTVPRRTPEITDSLDDVALFTTTLSVGKK